MEEEILKLLLKQWPFRPDRRAKEIASLYKDWAPADFTEWKDKKLTMLIMSYDSIGKIYVWEGKLWTLAELYSYWGLNIKKK